MRTAQHWCSCILLVVMWWLTLGINTVCAQPLGFADAARYARKTDLIHVQGWVHTPSIQSDALRFHALIDGNPTRVIKVHRLPRPDAAQNLNLPADTLLGFELQIASLSGIAGRVDVVVEMPDGGTFTLPAAGNLSTLTVQRPSTPQRHLVIAAVCAFTIVGLTWAVSRRKTQGKTEQNTWSHRAWAWWLAVGSAALFVVLVTLGITGSSMGALVGTDNSPNLLLSAESTVQRVAGSARSVRSDEWLVMTGNLLAQVNHVPPFPVINTLLGPDGQNMMVIGMTGVPVAHISALARPATWGFFFLPLQQALAWYWFLPIFACLLALWALLQQLAPQRPGRNVVLAMLFCAAPYAAGWSYWPLYVSAWACASLALSLRLLHEISTRKRITLAILLGWAMACLGLSLYPPWQITVATLLTFVFIAYCFDQRHTLRWHWNTLGSVLVAMLVCGAIMVAWWLDAREAIDTMRATVYPGQRAALHGGDLAWPTLLRGYGNVNSLPKLHNSISNESEMASYFLLLLPLCVLILRQARASRRWLGAAILMVIAFAMLYGMVGIPVALSKLMFWHYVPTNRLDLLLGLASVLLMALLPSRNTPEGQQVYVGPAVALGMAMICVALITSAMHAIPVHFDPNMSLILKISMAVCGGAMSYWWMRGHVQAAIALNLLIYLMAIAEFNPVARAPQVVSLSPELATTLSQSSHATQRHPPRILLLSDTSMTLAAAGFGTLSGVFYYPQRTLWKGLGLPQDQWPLVNRYQHLLFVIGPVATGTYEIHNPSLDMVKVVLNGSTFDFAVTGADIVGSPESQTIDNPSLRLLSTQQGRNWYEVVHGQR